MLHFSFWFLVNLELFRDLLLLLLLFGFFIWPLLLLVIPFLYLIHLIIFSIILFDNLVFNLFHLGLLSFIDTIFQSHAFIVFYLYFLTKYFYLWFLHFVFFLILILNLNFCYYLNKLNLKIYNEMECLILHKMIIIKKMKKKWWYILMKVIQIKYFK